jgi:hypothetical protein
MIAWDPWSDRIAVGPWPDRTGWSDSYARTVGACFTSLHKMNRRERERMLFIEFNAIVVRDGVDSQVAHRAFLAIDEYRQCIPSDELGAEDKDGPFNTPWRKVVAERLAHENWCKQPEPEAA